MNTTKRATSILAALSAAVTVLSFRANAATYHVLPDDKLSSSDEGEVYNLMEALTLAEPGDHVSLGDGTYTTMHDRLKTTVDGKQSDPITIVGSRKAKLKAPSPSVRVEHSWITIKGFTVDGEHDSEDEEDSYVNKCVEVVGRGDSDKEPLKGFVMQDMLVENCGGECVRLKNFVTGAKLTSNTIQHCGLYDYKFGDGKNGEGIYIGTSTNQWENGEDQCDNNWVEGNTISTCGNECIEVKEGSSYNMIEKNVCSNQLDHKSGCYCARGDRNTIRNNEAFNCEGAGVRLGGKTVDGYHYGQKNEVYGNKINNAEGGAISIRVMPQDAICGNSCAEGPCIITGDEDIGGIEDMWDARCDD